MKVCITVGPRDEKMIELVKSTVANCQNEKNGIKMLNGKGEMINVLHDVGSCRNCHHCSKYDCDLMKLCDEYGFEKVYDAVFYAYGGNSQTVKGMEAFIWETITEEEYGLYLEMLSCGKIMAS